MAFRGTFDYTLDAKNRLTVPAKFRAQLSDGLVLSKGLEKCVALWTPKSYDGFVDQSLEGLNPMGPRARELQRFFSANAVDTELDAAGRAMVPGFLADYAGLSRDVVVTGSGTHLEIWARGAWSSYDRELAARVNDISQELDDTA